LKQLALENARLKRLVGELHLEKAVRTDVAQGNFYAHSVSVPQSRRLWATIRTYLGAKPVEFSGY